MLFRSNHLESSSKDHYEAVKDEVTKLKQAGAIKEVFYPEWLANTVVVKKKNRKWRVCVDFIDLNILAKLRFKHFNHYPLISGSAFFSPKGITL